MARVHSRPITGLLFSAALAGCQSPANYQPSTNLAFAARGEQSALYSRFSAATKPEIEFAEADAALDSVAREILREQAAWLVAHPETLVTLIAGAGPGDRDLAARRARATEAFLIDHGVHQSRIRLTIAGELAADRPLKMSNLVVTEVSGREDGSGFWLTASPFLASLAGDEPSSLTPLTSDGPSEPQTEDSPEPTASPFTPSGPTPLDEPSTPEEPQASDPPAPNEKPKRPNAGKGNGSEDGDPGNSAEHNKAGDE